MTREWVWLDRAVILAIHDMQLAEHGGGAGVRDAGLLDSALGKPLHLQAYGEPPPDAAALAATLRRHAAALGDFPLLARGNRLSVLPVTRAQWDRILALA